MQPQHSTPAPTLCSWHTLHGQLPALPGLACLCWMTATLTSRYRPTGAAPETFNLAAQKKLQGTRCGQAGRPRQGSTDGAGGGSSVQQAQQQEQAGGQRARQERREQQREEGIRRRTGRSSGDRSVEESGKRGGSCAGTGEKPTAVKEQDKGAEGAMLPGGQAGRAAGQDSMRAGNKGRLPRQALRFCFVDAVFPHRGC